MRNFLLVLSILFILSSCGKNAGTQNETIKIQKLSIQDVDVNGSSERIFMTLELAENFAITEARFNQDFDENVKMANLDKKYKTNEEWLKAEKIHKMDFMIRLLIDEVIYQEGLINEEIKINPLEVERKRSSEQLKITQRANMTLKDYLARANVTPEDFETQIRKKLYRDKVIELQLKFLEPSTPTDIKNFYNELLESGRLSKQIRTTYVIEIVDEDGMRADMITKSINNLNEFKAIAEKQSTHKSKKQQGFLMDVPFVRSYEMQKDETLLVNKLFAEIWKCEPKVPTVIVKNSKTYILWVDSEENKVQPLDENIQSWIVNKIYTNKRLQLEGEYAVKTASKYSFSVRIGNTLTPADLKYFITSSGKYIEEEVNNINQDGPLEE